MASRSTCSSTLTWEARRKVCAPGALCWCPVNENDLRLFLFFSSLVVNISIVLEFIVSKISIAYKIAILWVNKTAPIELWPRIGSVGTTFLLFWIRRYHGMNLDVSGTRVQFFAN